MSTEVTMPREDAHRRKPRYIQPMSQVNGALGQAAKIEQMRNQQTIILQQQKTFTQGLQRRKRVQIAEEEKENMIA